MSVEHIAMQRKRATYPATVYLEARGLMSYGIDLKDQFRGGEGARHHDATVTVGE